jgi:hypothetical protein
VVGGREAGSHMRHTSPYLTFTPSSPSSSPSSFLRRVVVVVVHTGFFGSILSPDCLVLSQRGWLGCDVMLDMLIAYVGGVPYTGTYGQVVLSY